MRAALVITTLAWTASVSVAMTPYTGPWTQVWDFNSGSQGWVGTGAASYVASGWNGTGMLYAPDTSHWTLDVNTLGLGPIGNGPGISNFVLQADVYVGAINYLQGSGIAAAREGDLKGPWATGTAAGNQGIAGMDKTWYSTTRNKSWGLAVGQWTTLQIDYGVTTPGKFAIGYTACPGNAAGWPAGEWEWAVDPTAGQSSADVHPYQAFRYLMVGGGINGAQTGWAQAYYDNVKLRVGVPEPVTLLMLLPGTLIFRSRRRGHIRE